MQENIMGGKKREACGRCSISSVLETTEETSESSDGEGGRNPFDSERIELDSEQMESVVRHEVLASRLKERLDSIATRLIYS